MIAAVYFHRAITAFEHKNGTPVDEWIAADKQVQEYGVTCAEKGNAYVFEWLSRADRTKGKRKRIRVPLTNVSAVMEVEEVESIAAAATKLEAKSEPKLEAPAKVKP